MSKQKFHYYISGYRYAPESFHISKGLPDIPRIQISLSDEQRQSMGYLVLTQGIKAAVDYVKRIERERKRKCRDYMTYGYHVKENPRGYLYAPGIKCSMDAPLRQRLAVLKELRAALEKVGGKVLQTTECELNGNYRPVHVSERYATADYSRPLTVRLIVN